MLSVLPASVGADFIQDVMRLSSRIVLGEQVEEVDATDAVEHRLVMRVDETTPLDFDFPLRRRQVLVAVRECVDVVGEDVPLVVV